MTQTRVLLNPQHPDYSKTDGTTGVILETSTNGKEVIVLFKNNYINTYNIIDLLNHETNEDNKILEMHHPPLPGTRIRLKDTPIMLNLIYQLQKTYQKNINIHDKGYVIDLCTSDIGKFVNKDWKHQLKNWVVVIELDNGIQTSLTCNELEILNEPAIDIIEIMFYHSPKINEKLTTNIDQKLDEAIIYYHDKIYKKIIWNDDFREKTKKALIEIDKEFSKNLSILKPLP